jgi:hypothetical protein
MKSLTEEQIEDILQGRMEVPDDIDRESRDRLEMHIALRDRLKKAAGAIRMPQGLAGRVSAGLAGAGRAAPAVWKKPSILKTFFTRPSVAAAAAILIVSTAVLVFYGGPAPAQADVARIHREVLAGQDRFEACADPKCICERLEGKCSSCVELPMKLAGDSSYEGSAFACFRGRDVGAVLVTVGTNKVTIISVPDNLDSLGFGHRFAKNGLDWCDCAYENCRMAAVGLKDRTYIAVGEVNRDVLVDLLNRLINGK